MKGTNSSIVCNDFIETLSFYDKIKETHNFESNNLNSRNNVTYSYCDLWADMNEVPFSEPISLIAIDCEMCETEVSLLLYTRLYTIYYHSTSYLCINVLYTYYINHNP